MDRKGPQTTLLALLLLLSCCTTGNGSEQDGPGERERGKEPPALRGQGGVHPSPIAGSWYPKDPEALRRLLAGTLEKVPAPDPAATGSADSVLTITRSTNSSLACVWTRNTASEVTVGSVSDVTRRLSQIQSGDP